MKVFISRNINQNSIFYNQLNSLGLSIEGRSLVEFKPISFYFDDKTDWLFFYSKTGVNFFFQFIKPKQTEKIKLATLGEQTALFLEKISKRKVDFIGGGQPESTAERFFTYAKEDTVTFIRAENSRKSVQNLLEGKIIIQELIVYQNEIIENAKAVDAEILVFTSPLNVQAYFLQNKYLQGTKIFSIGETTTNEIRKFQIEDIYTVDEPSEKKLADSISKLVHSLG